MDFSRAAREVKCLVSCSTQTWLANFFSALLGNPLWPSAIRHGPLRSQNNRKNKRPVNAPIWRRCVAWGVTWLLKRKTMLEERKKGFGLGEGCIGWGGGGLVAPWECLATPTTFSRSCRSRWRPVISVLSLSSEGPDNQWALLGEAGANPLTPHPTPPPSADACVCVYAHGRGTQSQNACVCISGGCRGVWAHKWKAWIFLCCLHSCKTAYSQRDKHSINEDRLGKRRRQADNKEAFIVIW